MADHPIDAIIVNSVAVAKSDVRSFVKSRERLRFGAADDVRNTSLTGQLGGIYIAALQADFDLDMSDTTTSDDGLNCIVDFSGNRFKRLGGPPALFANFETLSFYRSGDRYSGMTGLTDWLAAGGGSFTRSTTATYRDRATGRLKTAAINTPRIHNDPVSGRSGILIEGSRTNLILRSQEFGTTWNTFAISVTSDAVAAPDGTISADKLVENTDNSQHAVYQDVAISAASINVMSVFIKAAERSQARLTIYDPSAGFDAAIATVNLAAGTISAVSLFGNATSGAAGIEAWSSGYFRVWMAAKVNGTATSLRSQIDINNAGSDSYLGDGASGLYLWGAQLEQASFPSSYIPTTSAQVTRGADLCVRGNTNGAINDVEGTVFAEGVISFEPPASTYFPELVSLAIDGDNRHVIYNGHGGLFYGATFDAGSSEADINVGSGLAYGAAHKHAYAYKADDFAFTTAAAAVGTDSSGSVITPASSIVLGIGGIAAEASPSYGVVTKIGYWPRRLSDADLQLITG